MVQVSWPDLCRMLLSHVEDYNFRLSKTKYDTSIHLLSIKISKYFASSNVHIYLFTYHYYNYSWKNTHVIFHEVVFVIQKLDNKIIIRKFIF